MSSILDSDIEHTKMSPLDDIKSTTSVESELMVTDMLQEEHEHHHHHHQHSIDLGGVKRKRQDDNSDDLAPRKLPSLSSNNNDVSFVLEDHNAEDGLHDETDDVSWNVKIFCKYI